jgi:repressor LexA
MKSKTLHPTQAKLLKLLAENIDDPVTFKELQEMLDVSSTSIVAHHMQQLEKRGYLKRNPYNPKDYQIIKGKPETPVVRLNLYGLATCGPSGSILDGKPIDRVPISSRLLTFPASEAFMVEAKGNSMEPRIYNGDYVIARKTSHIENGKVYVCVNEGKAIIKKIQQDGKNFILRSFNQEFQPFLPDPDFRIEGEVRVIISRKI